ncbi:MAG: hypothetical protein IT307_02745 [Chloroflexi bacterium]|nr:hypothetical protein [Chloroflexota bacterium]
MAFLSKLGVNQVTVRLVVADRLSYLLEGEIQVFGCLLRTSLIRVYRRDELPDGHVSPLERELATPRMRPAHKVLVGEVGGREQDGRSRKLDDMPESG